MTAYRLVADPRVDLDVAATHQWYENERARLGLEFLHELGAAYDRIANDPFEPVSVILEAGMLVPHRRIPHRCANGAVR